jgi:hypothetical protein
MIRPHPSSLLLVAVLPMLLADGRASAQVAYARDPATVVVRLTEMPGEIAAEEGGRTLEIHGDGRAVVHAPPYMRRAGDYETQLSAAEMDRIVQLVTANGLLDLDAAATRRAMHEADTAAAAAAAAEGRPRTVHLELDAAVTRLEVRVDGVARTITWTGVQSDAAHYPALTALQALATAERELRALMERPDLTRLP